jgi:hypothetical protein
LKLFYFRAFFTFWGAKVRIFFYSAMDVESFFIKKAKKSKKEAPKRPFLGFAGDKRP